MNDLLARLRNWKTTAGDVAKTSIEAADEIERLQSKLGEALERDRKGDEIIHELTLERDRIAGRLDKIRDIAGGDWGINSANSMRRILELTDGAAENRCGHPGCIRNDADHAQSTADVETHKTKSLPDEEGEDIPTRM